MNETLTIRDRVSAVIPGSLARGHWRLLALLDEHGEPFTDRSGAEALELSLKYYRRIRGDLARLRIIGTVRGDPPGAPRRWAIADADFARTHLGRYTGK